MSRVLHEPFQLRTWRELLYALLALPLGIIGFGYVVGSLSVSAALAVFVVGILVLAVGTTLVRYLSLGQRELARALVGWEMPGPRVRRSSHGFFGWLRSALFDPVSWRAYLYFAIKFPIGVALFTVSGMVWSYGIGGLTYPLWRPFLPEVADSRGVGHRAAAIGDDIFIDTWPRVLAASLAGALLVLAAPWVVRGVIQLDRAAMWALLSGENLFKRVRELETSRAYAVDDSAARLRRIERDLHDGAQARLVAVAMSLGEAKELLGTDAPGATDLTRSRDLVDAAHRDAKTAIVELRDLARGIHPPALDDGLVTALESLGSASAVPVTLDLRVDERPSAAIKTIAYFCVSELLTNVAKHAKARQVNVAVREVDGRLRLQVSDNGIGGAVARGGGGLAGLSDRVRAVDGRVDVLSPPGGPTVIDIDLPLHA